MIRETALKYLGYGSSLPSQEIEELIQDCITEVRHFSQPKAIAKKFHLEKEPLRIGETGDEIAGQQMGRLLEHCSECLLIGCTLGIGMERKIKYYEKIHMTKAVVMDAVASAYLEEFCDTYERRLGYQNRTYRACPGYGDFPLSFNRKIASLLDISKNLGVTITATDLLLPQKSMLGLIGIGSFKQKKSCETCVVKKDCPFRKRGQRCYGTESEKTC